jgi:ribulose 1,5-bisphosphate synthetase/thiazole synthase
MVFKTIFQPWRRRNDKKEDDGNADDQERERAQDQAHDQALVVSPLDEQTVTTATATTSSSSSSSPTPCDDITIAGAGIVGLVLALAIKKQLNITVDVYEQADGFFDDVGAGMGMYPNGLRVIRDISPQLLQRIQNAGCPYQYRRWMVRMNVALIQRQVQSSVFVNEHSYI